MKKIFCLIMCVLLFVGAKGQGKEEVLCGTQDEAALPARQEILKWIEDYRSYYQERNIEALTKFFKDTLFKGPKSQQSNGDLKSFLNNLNRIFCQPGEIKCDIDKISVIQSTPQPAIYGVNFHQSVSTGAYSDSAWYFLLWDFNDSENPQIHACIIQTDEEVEQYGPASLDDIFLP